MWEDADGASPVSTRLRARDSNVPSANVVTEEESLGRGKCETAASGTREKSTASVENTVARGALAVPKSASKPKKQYFGNVRIFNATNATKCLR